MQRLFVLVILFLFQVQLSGQNSGQLPLQDGLYHVVMLDTSESDKTKLKKGESEVFFSQLFNEFNLEGYLRLIVEVNDYVPLKLSEKPSTVNTSKNKKDLWLSLTKSSTAKLAEFTKKHLGEHVAIIVNGEALTMHVIKAIINDGKLKISRCTDHACEQLYIQLQDNVSVQK